MCWENVENVEKENVSSRVSHTSRCTMCLQIRDCRRNNLRRGVKLDDKAHPFPTPGLAFAFAAVAAARARISAVLLFVDE